PGLDAVQEEADGVGVQGERDQRIGLALEGHEAEPVPLEAGHEVQERRAGQEEAAPGHRGPGHPAPAVPEQPARGPPPRPPLPPTSPGAPPRGGRAGAGTPPGPAVSRSPGRAYRRASASALPTRAKSGRATRRATRSRSRRWQSASSSATTGSRSRPNSHSGE